MTDDYMDINDLLHPEDCKCDKCCKMKLLYWYTVYPSEDEYYHGEGCNK